MEFSAYASAIFGHWWALMSCAVFTILGVIQLALKKSNIWMLRVTFGAAVVLLFIASFLAWQDEHIANVSLKRSLDDLNMPQLKGNIDQIFTGYETEQKATGVYILASIRNTGASSIVEGWSLDVKHNFKTFPTRTMYIPDGSYLKSPKGKVIATFHATDVLYEKAMTPIQKGSLTRGWLRFAIYGFHESENQEKDIHYTVHFSDINGRRYAMDFVSTEHSKELPDTYLPALLSKLAG